jgi:Arc/MetJ-type ribon-helix-helix transcriptional regulator
MNDVPSFPADHEAFVDEAVKSGRYASRAEVIEEALLLLKRRDASPRDIGHWIALDDPERAITFVQELAEKCLSLSNGPSCIRRRPKPARASGSDGIANA